MALVLMAQNGNRMFMGDREVNLKSLSEVRNEDVREKLAALEHDQWAHWTKYMLNNLTPENIARWKTQIDTPYEKLLEKEKDSDRERADKVLKLVK